MDKTHVSLYAHNELSVMEILQCVELLSSLVSFDDDEDRWEVTYTPLSEYHTELIDKIAER